MRLRTYLRMVTVEYGLLSGVGCMSRPLVSKQASNISVLKKSISQSQQLNNTNLESEDWTGRE